MSPGNEPNWSALGGREGNAEAPFLRDFKAVMGESLSAAGQKATVYLQPNAMLLGALETIGGVLKDIAGVVMVYFVARARNGFADVYRPWLLQILAAYSTRAGRPHEVTKAIDNAVKHANKSRFGLFRGKHAEWFSDGFIATASLPDAAGAHAEEAYKQLSNYFVFWYSNRYEEAKECLEKTREALAVAMRAGCESCADAFVLVLQAKLQWRENNLGHAVDTLSEAIRRYGGQAVTRGNPTPKSIQYHAATAFFNRACYRTLITYHSRTKEPGRLLLTVPYEVNGEILADLRDAIDRDESLRRSAVRHPDLVWLYGNPEFLKLVHPHHPESHNPPRPASTGVTDDPTDALSWRESLAERLDSG